MATDLQADFAAMFNDSDDVITVDGDAIVGLAAYPGVTDEPFFGHEDNFPCFIIVQQDDLEDLSQWPVDDPEVIVNDITYRVIRSHNSAGHVQLFLQEA